MKSLKPMILRFESLPSTNTELARQASEGAGEGLSVVAEEQTAGRGRLQRAWSSPRGAGLYFSILLQPTIPQDQWPLITFMAALAVGDFDGDGFADVGVGVPGENDDEGAVNIMYGSASGLTVWLSAGWQRQP